MNILYLDCSSGISSDMVVSALVDLGADKNKLKQVILSIESNCKVEIQRVEKCSINAVYFKTEIEHKSGEHNHTHPSRIYEIINNSSLNENSKKIAANAYNRF